MAIVTKLDMHGEIKECYVRVASADVSRYSSPQHIPTGIGIGVGGSNPQKFWLHILYEIYEYTGENPAWDAPLLATAGMTIPYNSEDNKPMIDYAYDWMKKHPHFKDGLDV